MKLEEVKRLIEETGTFKGAAELLGVSTCEVVKFCKINEIICPRTRLRQENERFFTKKKLEEMLSKHSANYIAHHLVPNKTDASVVIYWAKRLGVKWHSISESSLLLTVRARKKRTNVKRYGCENPSQNEATKKKKRDKALKRYGVENVFQSKEIQEKSRRSMLERYGVDHVTKMDSFAKKQDGRNSKFHSSVEKILKRSGIPFKSEVPNLAPKFNKVMGRGYSPIVDIFIPDGKLVIECYGDYWHANPELYLPTDEIPLYRGNKKAEDIWAFDKLRKEQIESFGFTVLELWEGDFYNNKQKFEEKLLNEIRKSRKNIGNKKD